MATLKKTTEKAREVERKIYVLSFHEGRRYSTYGGIGLLDAFMEMQRHLYHGRMVVLMDKDSDSECMDKEIKDRERVSYGFAREFAKVF